MEKFSKPNKRPKRKKVRQVRKFKCQLCEKLVVQSSEIKVRKNYSHGKKSKADITYTHRHDGGCLVELKSKRK